MEGQKIEPFLVFEVEMPLYHQAPFRITREIDLRIAANQPLGNLVDEYWNPTGNWFFSEYFGPAFKVIREVPAATVAELVAFDFSYGKDIVLAQEF